jgi:hypothetical protein
MGFIAGFKFGKASKPGDWEAKYYYRMCEADAVVGGLTDSDFAGGHTDATGHCIGFGYCIADKTILGLTYRHGCGLSR